MQTSAMKACFQIAECNFSDAKISQKLLPPKEKVDFFRGKSLLFERFSPQGG